MIAVAVVVFLVAGSSRGIVSALVGAFAGSVAAAGLVAATRNGELADLHTPVGLVTDMLPLATVVFLLALVGSYAALATALAWTVGSVAAAWTAPQTGQPAYLVALVVNAVVAAIVVGVALRQTGRTEHR